MSRFDDEAFRLDGLDAPAELLPPGGLVAHDQALRVQRLLKRLPILRERAIRILEERAAERQESPRGLKFDPVASKSDVHSLEPDAGSYESSADNHESSGEDRCGYQEQDRGE